jgi:hypothetical protein
MYNKNIIDLNQIKIGDMFRFLIGVESINLYPSESICFIRTYCHTGEIYRSNINKLTTRMPINNYTFSTDVNNVFQKVVLEDQDISLIKTEVENISDNEQSKFINKLNDLTIISEDLLAEIDKSLDKSLDDSETSITSITDKKLSNKNIFSKQPVNISLNEYTKLNTKYEQEEREEEREEEEQQQEEQEKEQEQEEEREEEEREQEEREQEEEREEEREQEEKIEINLNEKKKRTYVRKNPTNKKNTTDKVKLGVSKRAKDKKNK